MSEAKKKTFFDTVKELFKEGDDRKIRRFQKHGKRLVESTIQATKNEISMLEEKIEDELDRYEEDMYNIDLDRTKSDQIEGYVEDYLNNLIERESSIEEMKDSIEEKRGQIKTLETIQDRLS